uniref:TFIIS N-terminal domain-containing protein n=1 Tax=Macrostomum lignano TaxID=282301 RepID=A0A1I8HCJ2_9PLAT
LPSIHSFLSIYSFLPIHTCRSIHSFPPFTVSSSFTASFYLQLALHHSRPSIFATEQRLEYFKSLARDGLIDSNGGIRAADSVPKLYDRMLSANKLVAKAIMLNVIKYTDQADKMAALCKNGGWQLLNQWLAEARRDENRALEKLLLEVFHRLPVTLDMLRSNDSAKMVKQIAKAKNQAELSDLAASLVDKWMDQIKAELPPQPQQASLPASEKGTGPSEHKRKRLDSGGEEQQQQQQRRSTEKQSEKKQQQPRKIPSTARTAPSHFRDTNLLASDELTSSSPSSSSSSGAGAAASSSKFKSEAVEGPSAAKRKRPDTDLESIHASISVKPTPSDSPKSIPGSSNNQQQQQQQQQQKKRPAGELHLDSGFMDSLFSNGGHSGAGGGTEQQQQHAAGGSAKLVRKRKKDSGGNSNATTPTTPEPPAVPALQSTTAQPDSSSATSPKKPELAAAASSGNKKSGRRVSWAPAGELEQVSYFELDETERVNVNRQSVEEMSKQEHVRERELLNKARKEGLMDGAMDDSSSDLSSSNPAASHRLQLGRPPQWYRPRPISDLPPFAAESNSGRKSTERARQAKRQEAILQVIYFSREAVPPSPAEPDVEHADAEEPKIIPLEEVSKPASPPPTTSAATPQQQAKPEQQQKPKQEQPVADILKQVTRNLTTASAGVPNQPSPAVDTAASAAASTSATAAANQTPKEALWRLLRSRYPDLHLQRTEDLTVDRIRSLLEPLKEELAASGMFPQ